MSLDLQHKSTPPSLVLRQLSHQSSPVPIIQIMVASSDLIDFTSLGPSPRRDLNFQELTNFDGYRCETHHATTEDGYILGIHRIPLSDSCPSECAEREPIVYTHGLLLCGDDCILPGPGKSHCYNLADACYDMWVINNRGNRYSRNHTTLNPDKDSEFWNFSIDEMASLDMPAAIDYILEVTNKKQVIIVAHSQGSTISILMCAKRPEYNDKIKIGFAMSPVSSLYDAKMFGLGIMKALAKLLDGDNNKTHSEIFPHGGLGQAAAIGLCGFSEIQYPVCISILFASLGYEKFQITPDTMRAIPGHIPDGTSLKNFVHWGQIKKYGFCEFNHGPKGNLKKYNQEMPPQFNLNPVKVRWILLAGLQDNVADVKDAQRLASQLENSEFCVIEEENFGHLDFVYADTLTKYVTPQILLTLKTGKFTCNKYQ
ncbi:lipase member K-like [Plodia interpunctella]|uniref:lipase member K-like n=1 Tax=Plodia interpunctella TaxID=58824 RepID=UPI0023689BEA|nr:lipase member K-like [Plodia interpunctella]